MILLSANNMRRLADMIARHLPKGMGFALFVFPFNRRGGVGSYISNASRETMIQALEEKLEQLKASADFKTPEGN